MDLLDSFAPAKTVKLSAGTIRYRDIGSGPTIVFIHGVLVSAGLWRHVIPELSKRYRCILPDMPLGAHPYPLEPEAERTPPGMATLVAELLATLELVDVTLVGCDSGGAICQLTIAGYPERIARLVLTNCDAYEVFPPWPFLPLSLMPRLLGQRFGPMLGALLRPKVVQRAVVRTVSNRPADDATLDAFFGRIVREPAVRADLIPFLASCSKRYTYEAAKSFPTFDKPVLLAWGENDRLFPVRLARRLHRDFPHATLALVPGSRAFVSLDQPERLAQLIAEFIPA